MMPMPQRRIPLIHYALGEPGANFGWRPFERAQVFAASGRSADIPVRSHVGNAEEPQGAGCGGRSEPAAAGMSALHSEITRKDTVLWQLLCRAHRSDSNRPRRVLLV